MNGQITSIIEKEGEGYVSWCPEVDISSQGKTVNEACKNLQEALELFFEFASYEELDERLHDY
jgi:predicted RNase H-like HicB family nuclease